MAYRIASIAVFIQLLLAGCSEQVIKRPHSFTFPVNILSSDSIHLLADSLTVAARKGSDIDKAAADIMTGLYLAKSGAYRQSKQRLLQVLKVIEGRHEDTLMAITYRGLASATRNLGEYPEALRYYSKALEYYKTGNDPASEAGLHAGIAQLFQLKDDLPQASIHLNIALALLKNQQHSVPYLVTLHTLANVYGMRGKLDSALLLDEQGLRITRQMNLPEYTSTFLDNKANCFMYSNRPDSARYYFRQCLAIDSVAGNVKQLSDTWLNLGTLENMQHDPAKAIEYLTTSVTLASEAGYRQGELAAWNMLAGIHKTNGKFETALDAQSRAIAIKDSMVNTAKETALEEWKAIFENEKKDKEIRLHSVSMQQKNIVILALIIIALLGFLALYFASRRNKIRKEKAFQQELFTRGQQAAIEILSAEERERKRIAEDLHDGIGQTMTAALLNLQALEAASPVMNEENAHLISTTTKLVSESCTDIRQISHVMMPNTLFRSGLLPALEDLTRQIHERKFSVNLSFDHNVDRLEKTTELVLYRAIQECVNNVIKHSNATMLDISVTREENNIAILIEDNGKGFDPQSSAASGGTGMQNIRSRIAYLNGTVEWSSKKDTGTLVAIHIPG